MTNKKIIIHTQSHTHFISWTFCIRLLYLKISRSKWNSSYWEWYWLSHDSHSVNNSSRVWLKRVLFLMFSLWRLEVNLLIQHQAIMGVWYKNYWIASISQFYFNSAYNILIYYSWYPYQKDRLDDGSTGLHYIPYTTRAYLISYLKCLCACMYVCH